MSFEFKKLKKKSKTQETLKLFQHFAQQVDDVSGYDTKSKHKSTEDSSNVRGCFTFSMLGENESAHEKTHGEHLTEGISEYSRV